MGIAGDMSNILQGGGAATPPPPATGATAGSPGTWTPAGSTPPANNSAANTAGIVATPATTWTTGQYVQGSAAGGAGEMHWAGGLWLAGRSTGVGLEYDPGDDTVEEVKAHVEANPDEVDQIYHAELAGKSRTTLIDWLEFNYELT